MKLFKIFISPWIEFFTRSHISPIWILYTLQDQYELPYWAPLPLRRTVREVYGYPYWITLEPFYPDPLPDWLVAVILAAGIRRFPRLTLGHEAWQFFRDTHDPEYTDIRIRAGFAYHHATPERRAQIRAEIERIRAAGPTPSPTRAWSLPIP